MNNLLFDDFFSDISQKQLDEFRKLEALCQLSGSNIKYTSYCQVNFCSKNKSLLEKTLYNSLNEVIKKYI